MATLTRSITIDAPVDTVFDVALDISQLWKMKDVEVTDVDIKSEGVGTSARLNTHLLGFRLAGGVEYTEVVPGQRIVAQVHFFAEKPTWRFTFEPADGGTQVTVEAEWDVDVPVVGKPIERMMVKEHEPYVEAMLAELKTQVEAKTAA
ncbi:SRPBCC family protein [Paenarthrobacter sp. DKR-5]|uniref:SRPBCC family protein n=1 Tax=Paenarthrobacter sp. DKR-5 TaxID=2835535 RepID=UPI001BDBF22E|nr:SRPBCC family protein [Paenarthrobacter sp. DKR-5]MBT1002881.1 SRPBCC family protein [Paenarthrobacter sp. DKR-5]